MHIKCELKEECKFYGVKKYVFLGVEGASVILTPLAISSSAGVGIAYATFVYAFTMALDYFVLYEDNFLELDFAKKGVAAIFTSIIFATSMLGKEVGIKLSTASFLSASSFIAFPEFKLKGIGEEDFIQECCLDISGKTSQFDLEI